MRTRTILACAVVGLCSLSIKAQATPATSGTASATNEASKSFDAVLTVFEHDVMGAAKAMPADKYDFAPSKAIFVPDQNAEFATVRTFGQEVGHLAQVNYFLFGAISGLKPDVDVKAIGSLKTKDELVAALAASIAFGHKSIATLNAENLFTPIRGFNGMNTRAALTAFSTSHGYDHYGQLVEYLRMNGIVPPATSGAK